MIILTDIHGNFKTMVALLDKIPEEEKKKGIVVCGDLVDRGPRSKEVVQYMIDNNILCVRGNHEDMMVEWVSGGCSLSDRSSLFLLNGGSQTLNSYRFEEGDLKGEIDLELVKAHAKWMDLLPYYLEFPEVKNSDGRYLVITHSGVGKVWKYKDDPTKTGMFNDHVTWNRYIYNDNPEIYNVFGHTPQEEPRLKSFYSNIDTGCAYIEHPGYGKLTALQFPEMIIYQEDNIDFVGRKKDE